MSNLLKEFIDWLTYNPSNVPLYKMIFLLIYFYAILFMLAFIFYYAVLQKSSSEVILYSFSTAGYLMLSSFWIVFALGEPILVTLLPVYPVIIAFIIMICIKERKHKNNE